MYTEKHPMSKTLALLHTGAFHAPTFSQLCREIMPDVAVFNIVDESLINCTIAANELTPATARRVANYLHSAEEGGADAILVTCSSIGPAVEAAAPFINIPVLRVDQPMADRAVQMGRKIGVIATLPTTLQPTADLITARAAAQGQEIALVTHLCAGAFAAVIAGDTETHDRLVKEGLQALMPQVEVIVLAQASMARVVDTLTETEKPVPILASPRLGVEGAKAMMTAL
jgi:Asp/Glu/hydantoin racemase